MMKHVRPGQLAHLPEGERAFMQGVLEGEVAFQIKLFDETGDERHLWRAWCEARATGEISPAALALLAPRIDALAFDRSTADKVVERESSALKLIDYYHELSRQTRRNLTAARRAVAARHGTSEGAINQLVMEHEGRGQRGKNRKNR